MIAIIGIDVTQEFSKYINTFDTIIPDHCGPITYSILEELPFIIFTVNGDLVEMTISTKYPTDNNLVGTYDATLVIDLPEWPESELSIHHQFQVTLEGS